jgi:tetratricopeptide (TPR) repeat protein
LKAYEQAIELDRTFYDAYFNIALMAEEEGDEQKAYDYYKKTLLYAPDHFWANLNLGSFYEKRDYLELALEHTERAYRIDPKEKMVAYNLGVVYGKMKDFEKAKKYYLEEISKSNGYILAYSNLAIIYKDAEKDFKKARYYYLQGISKDKDNTLMWYNLGCLYVLMNDYENANNCLLYANMRDKTIFSYMEKDEELKEYRLTDSYSELLKKIKG